VGTIACEEETHVEEFPYGIGVVTTLDPATAEALVREALAEEGFGILTEIDVAVTLRAKLGVERSPYKILGACNPPLAHRALTADEQIGLLLPCNVVVYAAAEGTVVAAMEPGLMAELSVSPVLAGIASEARERLARAIGTLEGR
jgi:uncharacterized protein (DUF302 family)